ncbi:MAG: VOC family protein [Chitinophagaceae bacterium]|nr:VOC family protein [Chitinophagaceae bacterium]
MQQSTPLYPCLWFDGNARAAVQFYCEVFAGDIISENPMVLIFRIRGQQYMALNGGPQYQFTPAISFVVSCDTQDEIDLYWEMLGYKGHYQPCGWLTDQFGVSWQVVPKALPTLMNDPQRGAAVVQALLKMQKIDIAALEQASA